MQEKVFQTDTPLDILEKVLSIRYFLLLICVDRKDELELFTMWLTNGSGYEFNNQFLSLDNEFKKLCQKNSIYQYYFLALLKNNRSSSLTISNRKIKEDEETEIDEESEHYQSISIKNFKDLFSRYPKIENFFSTNFIFFKTISTAWQSNYQDILNNSKKIEAHKI